MKKLVGIILILVMLMSLVACSTPIEQDAKSSATSIVTKKSEKVTFIDSSTGEQNEITKIYLYDGFTRRDDGFIQFHSHFESDGNRTDVISFYTSSGRYIGERTSDFNSANSDYLDLADTQTVEGYLKSHSELQEIKDNIAYYADGSYTKLTVEDGLIVGEDTYDSSGTHIFHYRAGNINQTSELWIGYAPEINDFTTKIETTYDEVPINFD